ncbi:hypothetical protein K488DRAFT_72441 [Vararia minispora EC-137]|uniref:Uncharacterized protein n=1 Tax=Vararia minispora EC-137 TaxID=1314806 RepID=A0ACB8QEJ9_9AGAM|nr:hypothetical protein K488DRAFT_72441 [Vararia minispora EC-137]
MRIRLRIVDHLSTEVPVHRLERDVLVIDRLLALDNARVNQSTARREEREKTLKTVLRESKGVGSGQGRASGWHGKPLWSLRVELGTYAALERIIEQLTTSVKRPSGDEANFLSMASEDKCSSSTANQNGPAILSMARSSKDMETYVRSQVKKHSVIEVLYQLGSPAIELPPPLRFGILLPSISTDTIAYRPVNESLLAANTWKDAPRLAKGAHQPESA